MRGRTNATLLVRADQPGPLLPQTETQRITVVAAVGDHPLWLLPRAPRPMSSTYADGLERRLREPDFRRGCRVTVVSQRKTRAVGHHHPLRAFPPAGFAHSAVSFLARAKLLSRNDSLHCNCRRSFSSLRKERQIFSHKPNGFAGRWAGNSCIGINGIRLRWPERLALASKSKSAWGLVAEEGGFEPPRPFRA